MKFSLEENAEMFFIRDFVTCVQLFKNKQDINLNPYENNKYNGNFNYSSNTVNSILYGISAILKKGSNNFFDLISLCIKNYEANLIIQKILIIYLNEMLNRYLFIQETSNKTENNLLSYGIYDLVDDYNQFFSFIISNPTDKIDIKIHFNSSSYQNNNFIDIIPFDKLLDNAELLIRIINQIDENTQNIKNIINYKDKEINLEEQEYKINTYKRNILMSNMQYKIIKYNNETKNQNKIITEMRERKIDDSEEVKKILKNILFNSYMYFTIKVSPYKKIFYSVFDNFTINDQFYNDFKKDIISDICLVYYIECLIGSSQVLEALFLSQYNIQKYRKLPRVNKTLNYSYMISIMEKSYIEDHDINLISLFFNIPYLESLGSFYYENSDEEKMNKITESLRKVSLHQLNKKSDYKKTFKILNFFRFFEFKYPL